MVKGLPFFLRLLVSWLFVCFTTRINISCNAFSTAVPTAQLGGRALRVHKRSSPRVQIRPLQASGSSKDQLGENSGISKLENQAKDAWEKRDEKELRQILNLMSDLLEEVDKKKPDFWRLFELNKEFSDRHRKLLDEKEAQEETSTRKPQKRIASVEFEIKDTDMQFKRDLVRFSKRVEELFQWHKEESMRTEFLAPYFPLVQSSGMGKTKLLYEYSKVKSQQTDEQVVLIRCEEGEGESLEGSIYHHSLQLSGTDKTDDRRDYLCKRLDGFIRHQADTQTTPKKKWVLLFDEAQHLLANDGWDFRCVRWWLRRNDRGSNCQVVAVFTGTTSKLANYYKEAPKSTTSRDVEGIYYQSGSKLYPPFYDICTIGLAKWMGIGEQQEFQDNATTEYDRAICYGRPLFALMKAKGELTTEKETNIARRMLLGTTTDLKDKLDACYSILGTRVQLGQTSLNLASDLVSRGYASLVSFYQDGPSTVADICFFPDPVCARLAMALMLEGSFLDSEIKAAGDGICKNPIFWTERATELFSRGLCRPHKGDLGEVAATLYLLFCGDVIRSRMSSQLSQFSVPLHEWTSILKNPSSGTNQESSVPEAVPHVSFIQVCRNYLRHSVKQIQENLFRDWYQAGRAVYSYEGCTAYDLIAPIKYKSGQDGSDQFCPLLISVKNQQKYSPGKRDSALDSMLKVLTDDKIKVGVCMLVLVGLGETKSKDRSRDDYLDASSELDGIYTVVVEVRDDPFGIQNFIETASTGGGEVAEVYTSHAEIASSAGIEPTESLLRKYLRKEDSMNDIPLLFLDELLKTFTGFEQS